MTKEKYIIDITKFWTRDGYCFDSVQYEVSEKFFHFCRWFFFLFREKNIGECRILVLAHAKTYGAILRFFMQLFS